MSLFGQHFIAGSVEPGTGETFTAIHPVTGEELKPSYAEVSPQQIDRACEAAAAAAPLLLATEPAQRAALLRRIADGLLEVGEALVQRVSAETALPAARVEAERGRTMQQLRVYADQLEEGSWVEAYIDHGDPSRKPAPKPDVRRMLIGIGPVVVFGASNFPLAYSVAGGDTASALAAGCPVVVKGHPAHPGTSELVGRVVGDAVQEVGLPAGTFSLVHGRSNDTGGRLVQHPAIRAVGFTGSHGGGRALFDLAAARPEPIPVFSEMGSMNPVVILPRALQNRGPQIAEQLAASSTLASGQFCTSPGMVLSCRGAGDDKFAAVLHDGIAAAATAPTVHPSIRAGYERAIAEVQKLPVKVEASGRAGPDIATGVCPTVLSASAEAVRANPRLRSEIFGPSILTVSCADRAELLATVSTMHGHLTATVHGDGDDFAEFADVIAVLRDKVGRLIRNGVPTGVEVCGAMVHGGPYPAATDSRFSAVGQTAILRWVRPVCWQDWPDELLPTELQNANSRRIRRTVDGVVQMP